LTLINGRMIRRGLSTHSGPGRWLDALTLMAGSPRAFGEERLTWGGQAARGEFVTMLKVL